MAGRTVRPRTPYGALATLTGWLAQHWALLAGEYAFYNAGAWLGDVPLPRLYEIAYFLAHREYVQRIDTDEGNKARSRALIALDNSLQSTEQDDDTGLPAGLAGFGIGPADQR